MHKFAQHKHSSNLTDILLASHCSRSLAKQALKLNQSLCTPGNSAPKNAISNSLTLNATIHLLYFSDTSSTLRPRLAAPFFTEERASRPPRTFQPPSPKSLTSS